MEFKEEKLEMSRTLKKIRWEKEGIFRTRNGIRPHVFLASEHIKFVFKARHIGIREKLELIKKTDNVFRSKHQFSKRDLIKAFLYYRKDSSQPETNC